MNEKVVQLRARSKRFALDVLALVRTLPASDEARAIAGQLIRSGTGVAANYRAACRSRSGAEFVSRIAVALEEADESALWLEILTEAAITATTEAGRLLDESNQLSAIFAQSRLTALENLERRQRPSRRQTSISNPNLQS